MPESYFELVAYAMRVFFLVVGPVVLAMLVLSTIFSVLQAATAVKEPVLLYTVRLGSLLIVGYIMYPTWAAALQRLALMAFE